jgi:glycosyltransferase involved in cell wall biosynthesis
VLDVSRLIKSAGLSLTVRIIGTAPPRYSEYLERLRSETAHLPVIWDLGLSETQIAERLAEAFLAYLPYPDGASERRTTLKAALLNGVAVLTTRGPQTPRNLGRVVRFCQTAEDALVAIRHLTAHTEEMAGMVTAAAHFGKTYSWERIAELHLRVYRDALSQELGHGQIESHPTQLETRVALNRTNVSHGEKSADNSCTE